MPEPTPEPTRDAELTDLLNAIEPSKARGAVAGELYARCHALVRRVKGRGAGLGGIETTDLLHRALEKTLLAQRPAEPPLRWNSREHFFATLARATVEAIIDERRHRAALKRGGGVDPGSLVNRAEPAEDRRLGSVAVRADREDLGSLAAALEEFATIDPRACTVVVLRVYWELQICDIAESLGISERSVNRDWLAARAWLAKRLAELGQDGFGNDAPGADTRSDHG
jgi:RNA polymerase sigma factor (TIGR02999 family)